jgi:peptidyl-prolyl cis-trans isomerase B (cyclophilin B)
MAAAVLLAAAPGAIAANPQVEIKTSMGSMTVELYENKAPKTVKNFLEYVNANFYSGTIFHRVIPGFMVQGGGFTKDMNQKPTRPSIEHEGAACGTNEAGTLAMARTGDPNSATSQFFINVADNDFLKFRSADVEGFGYCVFGKVASGFDIVDMIAGVRTGTKGFHRDVPIDDVVLQKATETAD